MGGAGNRGKGGHSSGADGYHDAQDGWDRGHGQDSGEEQCARNPPDGKVGGL